MWGTSRRKSLGFDLENILVSFDNNELIIMMYWWRPHLQGIGPTAPKPFLLLLVYAEKALGEQLTFFASLMKDRCNKHVIRIKTICFCKCTFLTTWQVLTRNCVMFSMTFQLMMWTEMLCSQLKYLSIARTFINIVFLLLMVFWKAACNLMWQKGFNQHFLVWFYLLLFLSLIV